MLARCKEVPLPEMPASSAPPPRPRADATKFPKSRAGDSGRTMTATGVKPSRMTGASSPCFQRRRSPYNAGFKAKAGGGQHGGVAVRLRLRRFECHVAVGAGAVLHRHGLAQRGGDLLRHEAGDDVARAAGAEADDEADRPLRVGPGRAGGQRRGQGTG